MSSIGPSGPRRSLHKVNLHSDVKDFVDLQMSEKEYIIKIKRENVAYIGLQKNEKDVFEVYVRGTANG